MQMGFNNDIDYRGLVVHIQTEDHGLGTRKITSQVFHSGAILDSRTISYADQIAGIEDPDERDEFIRKQMRTIHKYFYRRIHEGHYDARVRLAPAAAQPVDEVVEAFEPAPPPMPVVPEDAGVETPAEMLAFEGFAVAGELASLGKEYELHSRGAPLTDEALAADRDVDELEPDYIDEPAATGPLGDLAPEAAETARAVVSRTSGSVITVGGIGTGQNAPVVYGRARAWRGFDDPDDDLRFAAALYDAIHAFRADSSARG
jgi:hypothetical protein